MYTFIQESLPMPLLLINRVNDNIMKQSLFVDDDMFVINQLIDIYHIYYIYHMIYYTNQLHSLTIADV